MRSVGAGVVGAAVEAGPAVVACSASARAKSEHRGEREGVVVHRQTGNHLVLLKIEDVRVRLTQLEAGLDVPAIWARFSRPVCRT